jgi:hypothetical protein
VSEQSLYRIGSVSAIVGSLIAIVANLLHPRSATVADPEAFLKMITESGIWVGDHVATTSDEANAADGPFPTAC